MSHSAAARTARAFSRVPAVRSAIIVYLTTDRMTEITRSNNAIRNIERAGLSLSKIRAYAATV